jgi:RimJ/RimL family protein N-acetyltransferase
MIPTLVGKYVTLRPIEVTDAEITQKWRTSGRAFLLNPGAQNVVEQAAWIAMRPDTEYDWIMDVGGSPVGMIALVDIDLRHHRAEAGHFLIGEPEAVQGKPIAAEATRLMYGYAFDVLGLHRVYGILSAENEKMVKWNLTMGMKEEGRLRDHYFLNGHFQDAICLGLFKDEYLTLTMPRLRSLIGS